MTNNKKIDKEINEVLTARKQKTQAMDPPETPAPPAETPVVATEPMIEINCPHCAVPLVIPESWIDGQCPHCKGLFNMQPPQAATEPAKTPKVEPKKIAPETLGKIFPQQQQVPQQLPQQQQQQVQQPVLQQQIQQPVLQQQQPDKKSPFVEKRLAAMDVLRWLRTVRIIGMVAIFGSIINLFLGMFFLDLVGIVVVACIFGYVAFTLVRVTRYETYLRQTYNLAPQKMMMQNQPFRKQKTNQPY